MLYLTYALMVLHTFVGLILIGIVLLQRGRGGGLAGSFGGMGGQSAFGTKAGDVFTKITIGVAIVWFVLAGICTVVANSATKGRFKAGTDPVLKAPAIGKDSKQSEAEADDKASSNAGASGNEKDAVPPSPEKDQVTPDPASNPEGKTEPGDGGTEKKKPSDATEKATGNTPDESAADQEKIKDKPAPDENADPK